MGPLWFTPRKNCHNDHGVWGHQKTYFKGYIIPWHGSTNLQWERQKRCSSRKRQGPMVQKSCRNDFLWILFLGYRRGRQEKTRKWLILIFFSTFPNDIFQAYTKKSTHSFSSELSFLLVHIRCTPSEELKGFVNCFKKNTDHESWTMKSDHGNAIFHGLTLWSMV